MTDAAATIQSLLGPDPTPEQQAAADALLAALTPRMAEPLRPGAAVMAACSTDRDPTLHVLRLNTRWECRDRCLSMAWDSLRDPRPLTPDEYREYGIPMPAEPITDELVERCTEASTFMYPASVRAVLRAAGHPEAKA